MSLMSLNETGRLSSLMVVVSCVISLPLGGITSIIEGRSKGEGTGRVICAGCLMSPGIRVSKLLNPSAILSKFKGSLWLSTAMKSPPRLMCPSVTEDCRHPGT